AYFEERVQRVAKVPHGKSREPCGLRHPARDRLRQSERPEPCTSVFACTAREAIQDRQRVEQSTERMREVFFWCRHPVDIDDQPRAVGLDRRADGAHGSCWIGHIVKAVPSKNEVERCIRRKRVGWSVLEGDVAETRLLHMLLGKSNCQLGAVV